MKFQRKMEAVPLSSPPPPKKKKSRLCGWYREGEGKGKSAKGKREGSIPFFP